MPLLASKIPKGWTLSLVDNPGFGERNELVEQLTMVSMVTSSAYIYLTQTENVRGREAFKFFKGLQEKDKGKHAAHARILFSELIILSCWVTWCCTVFV